MQQNQQTQQSGNPMEDILALKQAISGDPNGYITLMERRMPGYTQKFQQFVQQNQNKTPQQILQEHGGNPMLANLFK